MTSLRPIWHDTAASHDSSLQDLFLVHYSRSSAFATYFFRSQIRDCFLLMLWDSELWVAVLMDFEFKCTWWHSVIGLLWEKVRNNVAWLLFLFDCSCHTTISLLRLLLLPAQCSTALTVTTWHQCDKTIPLPSRPCLPWEFCSHQISSVWFPSVFMSSVQFIHSHIKS